MKELISLDEMRTLIAVHDCGSMTQAAIYLEIIVSTVSRNLAKLEEKLEISLVRRHTRKIELTQAGLDFLNSVRPIVQAADQLMVQFRQTDEQPSGKLRINAASPALIHLITPMIQPYLEQYPLVEIELQNNEEIIDIVERRADIAIRIGGLKDSSLHLARIGYSQRRILASPAYLERCGMPTNAEELTQHCLLGLDGANHLNTWPILTAEGKLLRIQPKVSTANGEVLRQLILAGVGIGCLTDFMSITDRHSQQLIEILPDDCIADLRDINAIYYRGAQPCPKVSSFIQFLKASFAK